LYAALMARLTTLLNHRVGFLNPTLYDTNAGGVVRDITCCGTNAQNGAPGYPVGTGWDATTGLGSIVGAQLLAALQLPQP
jgi:hypothetical protein